MPPSAARVSPSPAHGPPCWQAQIFSGSRMSASRLAPTWATATTNATSSAHTTKPITKAIMAPKV